ncbi:unnamed protein product [Coffea canephora]|uniref:DH200=94 genomic scaffold, scaffold_868 n=1 Tax=Coffea canephora TaxID=49390 RepID=A0A068VGW4_COFCA|nr:unnamed protein product [Coffea canephora]
MQLDLLKLLTNFCSIYAESDILLHRSCQSLSFWIDNNLIHIDQVNRLLEHGDDSSKGMKKYAAIGKWNTPPLRTLSQTICNRGC